LKEIADKVEPIVEAPNEKLRNGVRAVAQGKVKNPTWDYSRL